MSQADDPSQLSDVSSFESDDDDEPTTIVGEFSREFRPRMPGSSIIEFTSLDDDDIDTDKDADKADKADNDDKADKTLPLPFPPPHSNDSIDTMMRKIRTLSDVIRTGKSIAVATGFARTVLDPEAHAFDMMSFEEKIQYWAFKKGFPLPAFDFEKQRELVVDGNSFTVRHALSIAYETKQFDDQHAAWVEKNEKGMLPLLAAIQKVTEQRHATSLSCERFKKIAEVQILKKILRVVNEHKWRQQPNSWQNAPTVIRFNDALLARIDALARDIPGIGQGEAIKAEQTINRSSL